MIKKVGFCFSLIFLTVSFVAAAFLSVGTFRLCRGNYLSMDQEEIQKAIWEVKYKATLFSDLETELECSLEEYFSAKNDAQAAKRDEWLSLMIAEHVVKLCLTEDGEAAEAFAEKYRVKFNVYHYYGRLLCGNLDASLEKSADRRVIERDGKKYPVYVLFNGWELQDMLVRDYRIDNFLLQYRYGVTAGAVLAWFAVMIFWVMTKSHIGRRGAEDVNVFDRIPLELVCLAGVFGLRYLYLGLMDVEGEELKAFWQQATYLSALTLFALILVYFVSWRMQKDGWHRFTICNGVFQVIKNWARGFAEIFSDVSLTWKWLLAELLISALEAGLIIALLPWDRSVLWLLCSWGALKLILLPWIIRRGKAIGRLKIALERLAVGKLDTHLEEEKFPRALRAMARDVNATAGSVSVAVEEKLKSERLKTELITNVSHDVKTPLTSIINFSDLIVKEDADNPKIREYAEHLHAQSTRLKKLIEDLIEASKASSGNLTVHLEPCDARVLLGQCLGEYESRLKEKDLELILKQSEEPLRIMADPKMLWRVFDNLMNNACKYAQKDTRVYLSAERVEDRVRILFKNVSKYALDVSPEDLMERFVRGDLSRHTEGNGLGLSIVSSLMELQGGKVKVDVDADLFKVTLEFPVAANGGETVE